MAPGGGCDAGDGVDVEVRQSFQPRLGIVDPPGTAPFGAVVDLGGQDFGQVAQVGVAFPVVDLGQAGCFGAHGRQVQLTGGCADRGLRAGIDGPRLAAAGGGGHDFASGEQVVVIGQRRWWSVVAGQTVDGDRGRRSSGVAAGVDDHHLHNRAARYPPPRGRRSPAGGLAAWSPTTADSSAPTATESPTAQCIRELRALLPKCVQRHQVRCQRIHRTAPPGSHRTPRSRRRRRTRWHQHRIAHSQQKIHPHHRARALRRTARGLAARGYWSRMALRHQSFVRRREFDEVRHRMRPFGNPERGGARKVSDLGVSCNQYVFMLAEIRQASCATRVGPTKAGWLHSLPPYSKRSTRAALLSMLGACANTNTNYRGRGSAVFMGWEDVHAELPPRIAAAQRVTAGRRPLCSIGCGGTIDR